MRLAIFKFTLTYKEVIYNLDLIKKIDRIGLRNEKT